MKYKIFTILLAFSIALFGVNLLLWQWDKSQEDTVVIDSSRLPLSDKTESTVTEDYSVEKLNSQASVKQLRQALFSEPETIAGDSSGFFDVDENNDFANGEIDPSLTHTSVELNSEIERLSKELQALQESVQ